MSRFSSLNAAREAQMRSMDTPLTAEMQQFEMALPNYASLFHLSFETLNAEQLCILLAARNMEARLNMLSHTPLAFGATETSSQDSLLAQEGTLELNSQTEERPYTLPTDSLTVSQTRGMQDIPDLLPHQWAYEDVAPLLFLQGVMSGRLLRTEYLETAASQAEDVQTQEVGNFLKGNYQAVDTYEEAMILLDASSSMDNYDRRGVVAKGTALAFLRRARERGFPLHYAPFRTDMEDAVTARTPAEFQGITNNIIGLKNDGTTNIQRALSSASDRVLQTPDLKHCDLLLITDGLSKLTERPSEKVRLHSVLIGDIRKRTHWKNKVDLELDEQVEKLKEWSTSSIRIEQKGLRGALKLTEQDLKAFTSILSSHAQHTGKSNEERERAALALQELLKFLDEPGLQCADDTLSDQIRTKGEQLIDSLKNSLQSTSRSEVRDFFSELSAPDSATFEADSVSDSGIHGDSLTSRELTRDRRVSEDIALKGGRTTDVGDPLLAFRFLYRKAVRGVKALLRRIRK